MGFSGVRVPRSLIVCVIICRSLFVLSYFFFWSLCCLFFFDIRIMITPLVSCGHCVVCSSSIYGFWLPLWYLLGVSSSCSTSDTHRVNLVTNPVISHEWGKDREVLTTSGTYPWSFVTQIFHSGQPSDSEGWLRTKLYGKRDDFNFPIVNFPFICSNIPAAPADGVYISQLKRSSASWRSPSKRERPKDKQWSTLEN
jgi:hypothetical protein